MRVCIFENCRNWKTNFLFCRNASRNYTKQFSNLKDFESNFYFTFIGLLT